MKTTKILFYAALASLITVVTANSQIIIHNWYPPMTVNISGVITYDSDIGGNYGTYTKWDVVKVRFGSKDLINLLNSSATFTNVLYNVKGVTQIPAGSRLVIDINDALAYILQGPNLWYIVVTNQNGFSFRLTDVYDPVQNQIYTFLSAFHDNTAVASKFINATGVGHEKDLTALHFTFDDGQGTLFDFSGVGEFLWTTGPRENYFTQKVHVSGKVIGGGNAIYQRRSAVMQATLTVHAADTVGTFMPFQMWYPLSGWYSFDDLPPFVQ